jgi:DNA modification methylase
MLPSIIWRKSTTKPNKFMGSGMEPPNAYVTLEHEYVLIFRKGGLRKFSDKEKENRRKSAYFWEERNRWFSDVWLDLRGASQNFDVDKRENKEMRERSAAFPFEFAYRLINMFSLIGDTVLDPFCGTGTTMQAAAVSGRNSIGYEIDDSFRGLVTEKIEKSKEISKDVVNRRIKEHLLFVEKRKKDGKVGKKYFSKRYGFEVLTAQEIDIEFPIVNKIERIDDCEFEIEYTF